MAQEEKNRLLNPDFSGGFAHWDVAGIVSPAQSSPNQALKGGVDLAGPGSKVSQRYPISGERIVYFGATFDSASPATTGTVRVTCLDAHGNPVMSLKSDSSPRKPGDKPQSPGIYFKTQAFTASIVASVEVLSGSELYVGDLKLIDYDADRKVHEPTCNLFQYMQPLWRGNVVTNESVLMLSENGKPATGSLLFKPDEIVSVRDSTLQTAYQEGVDYTLSGKTLTCTRHSRMSQMNDSDFPKGDYPWLSVAGKHVLVSYLHHDPWSGPSAAYVGDRLPRTVQLLRQQRPVTIVAFGDSITLGINVSGYRDDAPYMPTWAELYRWKLERDFRYDQRITLYNSALGGMTSEWGKQNADSAVASLKPDLVLIMFGMNDFWSVTGEQFKSNIESMISTVRARNPHAEFVLISSIRFDPVYTKDPTYVGHFDDYVTALRGMYNEEVAAKRHGIAFLDMALMSQALYNAKKPKDLLADPMHPDDFLARWIAQSLVAMFENDRDRFAPAYGGFNGPKPPKP